MTLKSGFRVLFYVYATPNFTLCGIFSEVSVLFTTENSDNLEILVPGGSRSLNSSYHLL